MNDPFFQEINQNFGFDCMLLPMLNGKASDCIKCGQCEEICPQHLNITALPEDVAKAFAHETEG